MGARSHSPADGNKTSPHFGGADFWLVRVDGNGNKLWDKSFGGSGYDVLWSLHQTTDGGFILSGSSASEPNGNKTSPFFGGVMDGDFWIVRLDSDGNKLWDKSFGGIKDEASSRLAPTTDGGFLLAGDLGLYCCEPTDMWLVRVDAEGNKLWEQTLGGSGREMARSVQQTSDGGFIVGGSSSSPADGNKTTASFGGTDFWVIKLAPEALSNPPRLRPQAQSIEDIRQNGYRFFSSGVSNQIYVTEYSADLINWTPFQTNQLLSGELELVDATAENTAHRFYRARTSQ